MSNLITTSFYNDPDQHQLLLLTRLAMYKARFEKCWYFRGCSLDCSSVASAVATGSRTAAAIALDTLNPTRRSSSADLGFTAWTSCAPGCEGEGGGEEEVWDGCTVSATALASVAAEAFSAGGTASEEELGAKVCARIDSQAIRSWGTIACDKQPKAR